MKEKKVTIQVDAYGHGKAIIGDYDISSYVEAVEFKCEAGKTPVVKLTISPMAKVDIQTITNKIEVNGDAV